MYRRFGKSLAMLTAQPINQLCVTRNDTLRLSWRQPDNDLRRQTSSENTDALSQESGYLKHIVDYGASKRIIPPAPGWKSLNQCVACECG